MRTLEIGPSDRAPVKPLTSEFIIGRVAPVTRPGTYGVYLSVGLRDGTPQLALPLPDDDGRHRYRLGEIALEDGQ